jgi:glycerophosphoryl diester phosphodiesterase
MKPLVLGHRGASAYAPENTLTAFNLAFEQGADGVELDVTLTKDGIPVVIHDDTVDRTTNGHGDIRLMTLDQVKELDAAYKFDQYRGEKIPTLDEVMRAVGKRGIVNIELKGKSVQADGLEEAVLVVIEQTGTADNVIISSFNPFALYRMSVLNPRLPRGLLYADDMPLYLRRAWLRPVANPTAMHPKYSMIDERFVKWARSKKYKINTWTVDDPNEMRRLIGLGIDAIISNKPNVLRQTVG